MNRRRKKTGKGRLDDAKEGSEEEVGGRGEEEEIQAKKMRKGERR